MGINGNTLIKMGYKPAKWFGEVLDFINSEGSGTWSEEDIKELCENSKPEPVETIEPFDECVFYYKNIGFEGDDEILNYNKVLETMNKVMKTPTVVSGAVMPDACPAGDVGTIPVGGVVVTKNAIHPGMHSADICCSVMASNFGKTDPKVLLDAAHKITHFGYGSRKELIPLPESLTEEILNNKFTKNFLNLAENGMGTQGDGNHFLFVGESENTGDTFMVTHHGSRGFGAKVYKKAMEVAEKYRRVISPNTLKQNAWIPYDTEDGIEYWKALQIVRKWTKLNHQIIHMMAEVEAGSTEKFKEWFWNEHNFVFKQDDLFYHGKGATPLSNEFVPDSIDGRRLIPLNMSEPILVVKGEPTKTNLGFAPHGAGRNVSRSEHKRRLLEVGETIENTLKKETKGIDVRFYSGNPDTSELPSAYKNADQVQKEIEKYGLGEIVDRIMPYGSIMAGEQIKPWLK